MRKVKPGLYKHYKGNIYEVLFLGKESDTEKDVVIYRGLYNSKEFGKNPVWVRSMKAFAERVKVNGKLVDRFKSISKNNRQKRNA